MNSENASHPKEKGQWLRSPRIWAVVLILLLGAGFQWAHVRQTKEVVGVDARAYLRLAESVLEGKGFDFQSHEKGRLNIFRGTRLDGPTAFSPPIPILLYVPFVALGLSLKAIALSNAILLILAGILLFFVLVSWEKVWVAALAALLFCLDGPLAEYGQQPMTEAPFVLIMLAAALAATRLRHRAVLRGMLTGVLLGLALLCRGEALLFFPFVLWAGVDTVRAFWRDRYLGIAILTSVLVISPWVVRNYVVTGYPVLSRNGGGFNSFIHNNSITYDTDSLALGMNTHLDFPVEVNANSNEVAVDKAMGALAKAFILHHPLIAADAGLRRVLYLWQPMDLFYPWITTKWTRISLFFFFVLGLVLFPYANRKALPLLGFIVVYTAVIFILLGGNMAHRFRALAAPGECYCITLGIAGLVGAVRFLGTREGRARWIGCYARRLAFAAVPCIGLAVYCFGRPAEPTVVAIDFSGDTARLQTVSPPSQSPGVQLMHSGTTNALHLTNVRGYGWQGVWVPVPNQAWHPNRDYCLAIHARLPKDSGLMVRVMAYPSEEAAQKNPKDYQALNNQTYLGRIDPVGWKTIRLYFTSPWRSGPYIRVWVTLDNYKDDATWAEIDRIAIDEVSFCDRWIQEYFTDATSRRRGEGYFK